jgi:hypothetical protein
VISSSAFNALTADLATGLSTAITKDGQTATTARIPFAQGISSTLVTDSTSISTGSIITAGGAGIAKALYVGTTANIAGVLSTTSPNITTSITTPSTSFDLINATATTLNLGGAATAVNVGAATGTMTVANTTLAAKAITASTTLGVTGTTTLTGIATLTANPVLSAGTANGVTYLNGSKSLTSGSAITFDGTNFATTGTATATKLIPTGTSVTGNGLYLPAANALGLSTNGTNAVYIDSSQKVGIGITPSYKLDVAGTTRIWNGSDNGQIFMSGQYAGFNEVMSQIAFYNSSSSLTDKNTAYIKSYVGSNNNLGLLTFWTANGADATEKMRITAAGDVGIGTTSPISNSGYGGLSVNGTSGAIVSLMKAGTETGRIFTGGDETSFQCKATTGYITFVSGVSGGTERMRISSAGIVTMSAYGAGAATFSAAGVISSVSDETWKIKDGAPVDTDAMLQKLEPGYWYYNDEKKEIFGTDRQLGFYAQNVNAAIGPEAAPEPEEGKPWGYYDRSVLAVTVMSLQKALATIESLTARIAALESK